MNYFLIKRNMLMYRLQLIWLLGVLLVPLSGLAQQGAERLRIGEAVNTKYNETKPLISPTGKTLYFARQNAPTNFKGIRDAQDIYYSVQEGGNWAAAQNMGAPLNDRYPNGINSVSPDGNTLVVLNAYNGLIVRNGISVSRRQGDSWSSPEAIEIRNFYNRNDYVDYFLSSNEEEMVLAIETEVSFGDQDLYMSFMLDDSTWSEPVNLGPDINTEQAEFAPFLAADNRTLYFSSYGHDALGGCDIYYSRRLDNTWQKWSTPVNLGQGVNTPGFEAYFSITASGEEAFFVSDYNTPDKSRDIFVGPIPEELRPDPVVLITGKVYNKDSGSPMQASVVFRSINDESQGMQERGVARSTEDGSFSIILPSGHKYAYIAEADNYMGLERYINLNFTKEYSEFSQDLYLTRIDSGKAVLLPSVTFGQFGAELAEEAYAELKHLSRIMVQNPFMRVKIGSFSSAMFQNKSNFELSLIRSRVVRDFLVKEGIHPNRVVARGYGNADDDNIGNLIDITRADRINPALLNGRMMMEILTLSWEPPFIDADRDGIPDHLDNCPQILGTPANKGCPSIANDMQKVLDNAMRNCAFNDKRGVLQPISYRPLNQVASFLAKYADYKLKISTHTDNSLPPTECMAISKKRTEAIRAYLIDQGVDASRVFSYHYGDTKPIADNDTEAGRDANDRLELDIVF